MLQIAAVSPPGGHIYVRHCLHLLCEGGVSAEVKYVTSQYGAQTAAVVFSDLLDAALCTYSQHSEALAVAAANFLDGVRESVHGQPARQLETCLRLAGVQHSSMSCPVTRMVESDSSSLGACEKDKDVSQQLPRSLCPGCLGQHSSDVPRQSSVVLRRLMQVCVEADRCQSFDVSCWEEALNAFNTTSAAQPHPSLKVAREWNHQIRRVSSVREPWMQCIAFFDSAAADANYSITAIVLAPHLQNPAYSPHGQASSKCWSLVECSSVIGPVARIGALLQAVGVQAVALVARDWIALQAMAHQQANTSQLRKLVDEALLYAGTRRAL